MGSRNRRVILHIDLDCFYVQVEQKRLGIPRDVPVAVRQWDGLIAVGYAARARGVTRFLRVEEALQKCPELVMVHVETIDEVNGKVSETPGASKDGQKAVLERYRRAGAEIFRVFQRFVPICERASVDEAYLDVTSVVDKLANARLPKGIQMSVNDIFRLQLSPSGELSLRSDSEADFCSDPSVGRSVAPAGPVLTSSVDVPSVPRAADGLSGFVPEAEQERSPPVAHPCSDACSAAPSAGPIVMTSRVLDGVAGTFHARGRYEGACAVVVGDRLRTESDEWDRRLWLGGVVAANIRRCVYEELSFTCSAGVAHNKLFAKIGSAMNKPNKQTIIPYSAVQGLLETLPLRKIKNLGGKLGDEVVTKLNVEFAAQLQSYSEAELQGMFGAKTGVWLYRIVRGLDDSPVVPRNKVGSMGSHKSFPPIYHERDVTSWLRCFLNELVGRIHEYYADYSELPSVLTLRYRSSNKRTFSANDMRSVSCPLPHLSLSPPSTSPDQHSDLETLLRASLALFHRISPSPYPLTQLALSLHAFRSAVTHGPSIASFFRATCPTAPSAEASCDSEPAALIHHGRLHDLDSDPEVLSESDAELEEICDVAANPRRQSAGICTHSNTIVCTTPSLKSSHTAKGAALGSRAQLNRPPDRDKGTPSIVRFLQAAESPPASHMASQKFDAVVTAGSSSFESHTDVDKFCDASFQVLPRDLSGAQDEGLGGPMSLIGRPQNDVILLDDDEDEESHTVTGTFTCSRCGTVIAISQKQEHADFHVAVELQSSFGHQSDSRSQSAKRPVLQTQTPSRNSLDRFFLKKPKSA